MLTCLLVNWREFLILVLSDKSIEVRVEQFSASTDLIYLVILPVCLGLTFATAFPLISNLLHQVTSNWRQSIRVREDLMAIERQQKKSNKQTELETVIAGRIAAATKTRRELVTRIEERSGPEAIDAIRLCVRDLAEFEKDILREIKQKNGSAYPSGNNGLSDVTGNRSSREVDSSKKNQLRPTLSKFVKLGALASPVDDMFSLTTFGYDLIDFLEAEERENYPENFSSEKPS